MTHEPRATLRRVGRSLVPVLVGIGGAWLGMALWGGSCVDMGPFRVRLDSQFGRGVTDIVLPPFGHLTADTHLAPLRLSATLENVRIGELGRSLADEGSEALVQQIQRDAERDVPLHLLRTFGVAVAAAVGLALLAFRRQRRRVAAAVIAAALTTGGAQALAIATYRTEAFRSPTFSGALALAPDLIGPVRATSERISAFREQLAQVVDGAVHAYTALQATPIVGGDEIRVLHISDLHLSPIGFDFAEQIADGFDVNLIVDTGDTSSFGTPAETFVASYVQRFARPYIWVRGNHDSASLQAALARVPNVTVLDGDSTYRDGLLIYGLGDPVHTSREVPLDDRVFAERTRSADPRVLADVERMPSVPDIVAVHDDRMAESLAGVVPLVISGHFHEADAHVANGTLYLRVGSTSGVGPVTLSPDKAVPLSAEVLHFRPGAQPELIAYDLIEQLPSGSLTVTRHLIADEYGELVLTPPTPTPSEAAPIPPTPAPSAMSSAD